MYVPYRLCLSNDSYLHILIDESLDTLDQILMNLTIIDYDLPLIYNERIIPAAHSIGRRMILDCGHMIARIALGIPQMYSDHPDQTLFHGRTTSLHGYTSD